jgi:hypothetical protein
MKVFLWSMTIMLFVVSCVLTVIKISQWYEIKQKMAYLNLADDASTPAKKAEYLGKFIEAMEKTNLPEHAAFWWKTSENCIADQLSVVKSLKERCDELVGKDPESMGYATGIQQVTGQEFEHALTKISNLFTKAIYMKYGWFMYYGFPTMWIICGISLIFCSVNIIDQIVVRWLSLVFLIGLLIV